MYCCIVVEIADGRVVAVWEHVFDLYTWDTLVEGPGPGPWQITPWRRHPP